MAVQFAVLASGSQGNATLIRSAGAGLLVDLGIGPRALAQRFESVGASWAHVGSAVLTHTHGDHVNTHTLHALARRRIPLYCHEGHAPGLEALEGFRAVRERGLLRHFDERPFLTPDGLGVEPIELRHDGGPTFGFRVEARVDRGRRAVAIGYLADTGSWTPTMADGMAEVDLLGVEFNHDVEMQRRSRRPPALIARNLGDWGHLSNRQGADFVTAVLDRSGRGAVRHLVLLHLSQQCNRPDLALREARAAIRGTGRRIIVHAARQAPAHPNLWVEPGRRAKPRTFASGQAVEPAQDSSPGSPG
jgi:phosphoribosyl 1,2-cyclic phosphodiesterase